MSRAEAAGKVGFAPLPLVGVADDRLTMCGITGLWDQRVGSSRSWPRRSGR